MDAEVLASTGWNEAYSTPKGDCYIEAIPPMYLRFSLHIEKANVPYRCRNIFELAHLTSALRKSWQRCGGDVTKLLLSRDEETSFSPGNPFYFCTLHTQYKTLTSRFKQKLQETVEHEASKEKWTRLSPTQKLLTYNVRILRSNKIQKGLVDPGLADFNSVWKR